jgi:hypothetical protein
LDHGLTVIAAFGRDETPLPAMYIKQSYGCSEVNTYQQTGGVSIY